MMRDMTEEEVIANAERELAALGQGFLQTPSLPPPAPRGPAVRLVLELDHIAAAAALGVAGLGMAVAGGLDVSKLLAPVLEGMVAGMGPQPGGKPPDPSSRFLGMLSDLMKAQHATGAPPARSGCGNCGAPAPLAAAAGAHFMTMARGLAALTVASRTDLIRLNAFHNVLVLSELASRSLEGHSLIGAGGRILVALHQNNPGAQTLIDELLVTLLGPHALPGKGDEIQASWNKFGGRTPPPPEDDPIRGIDQTTFHTRLRGPFVKVEKVSLVTDEVAGTDSLTIAYSEVGFPLEETMILPRGAGQAIAASLGLDIGTFSRVETAKA
jgi:hypothetical protein